MHNPPSTHTHKLSFLQKFLGSFWRPSLQPSPLSHRELVPFEDALSSAAWQAHYRAGGGEIAQLPTGTSWGKSNAHYSLNHISFYDSIKYSEYPVLFGRFLQKDLHWYIFHIRRRVVVPQGASSCHSHFLMHLCQLSYFFTSHRKLLNSKLYWFEY